MKTHLFLSLILLGCVLSCGKDTVVGPAIPTVELQALRIEAIEVALKITLTDTLTPRTFALRRDGVMIASGEMLRNETTVVDTTVRPAQSYLYRALRTINGEAVDSSDVVAVTTLDTTLHSYTWEQQTIGVFQSSLSDVWGSTPNDVWAVGRITDTTAGFRPNATHFDGNTWSLVQIEEGFDVFGIFGFTANNIFAVGTNGRVYHWDGTKWKQQVCLGIGDGCSGLLNGEQLNAIWGTSSQELFAVGVGGVIVHYDGQRWTKMSSGAEINLWDVWGFNSTDVYCAGADFFGGQGIVLHYDGTQWRPIMVDQNPSFRHFSVWGANQNHVVTTGDFTYRFDGQKWRRLRVPDLSILKQKVVGTAVNDIFIVGDFGLMLHWNGTNWRRYDAVSFTGTIRGLWTDGKEVIAVGWTSALGVIIHGKSF